MSEAKHTTGARHVVWSAHPVAAADGRWWVAESGMDRDGARYRRSIAEIHGDNAAAVAQLMAASRDMLAALEQALVVHGDQYSWGPDARAAIAKATGEAA